MYLLKCLSVIICLLVCSSLQNECDPVKYSNSGAQYRCVNCPPGCKSCSDFSSAPNLATCHNCSSNYNLTNEKDYQICKKGEKEKSKTIQILVIVGAVLLFLLFVLFFICLIRKKKKRLQEQERRNLNNGDNFVINTRVE